MLTFGAHLFLNCLLTMLWYILCFQEAKGAMHSRPIQVLGSRKFHFLKYCQQFLMLYLRALLVWINMHDHLFSPPEKEHKLCRCKLIFVLYSKIKKYIGFTCGTWIWWFSLYHTVIRTGCSYLIVMILFLFAKWNTHFLSSSLLPDGTVPAFLPWCPLACIYLPFAFLETINCRRGKPT